MPGGGVAHSNDGSAQSSANLLYTRGNSAKRERAMLSFEPTCAVLGATVRGGDLAQPLGEREFGQILLGLGRYGVLRFPDQHLDLAALCHRNE